MIYEMFGDLRDRLRARKFPTKFEYGPDRKAHEGHHHSNLIVVERDRDQSDTLEPARGNDRNPRKKFTRFLAAKATIYARSNLPGAHVGEHEKACEALVDAFMVELQDWGTEARAGDIPIVEARYLSAADRDEIEVWPGVVYHIRFRVARGVRRLDYDGNGQQTGAAEHVSGTVEVRRNHGDPDDPAESVPLP